LTSEGKIYCYFHTIYEKQFIKGTKEENKKIKLRKRSKTWKTIEEKNKSRKTIKQTEHKPKLNMILLHK
jgi:hypothetical protein